ncbi:MAG: hypothetical protein GF408_06085 [Candidatus Omnitrophica bacterium]|nr:hypothetical protein [Candidatus Omnitrophota bacterium]
MIWIEFITCAALLAFFAYLLCREGVILSERTNMEEGLIGVVFLAIATSFPEITTGVAAITGLQSLQLGYGDIVGSIAVNLMVLFFLDIAIGKGRLLKGLSPMNRRTGEYVLAMSLVAILSITARSSGFYRVSVWRIGPESIVIALLYFYCLKRSRTPEMPGADTLPPEARTEPLWRIWSKFLGLLAVVMALGTWMAFSGKRVVEATGISETFTGTLLLGLATSLPEIIVSFTALKAASSYDMAVGNILGSNLFDISVISFFDLLTPEPIFGMLTGGLGLATAMVVVLSGITVLAMRSERDSRARFNWDTGLIFIVGLAGFVLLYFIK